MNLNTSLTRRKPLLEAINPDTVSPAHNKEIPNQTDASTPGQDSLNHLRRKFNYSNRPGLFLHLILAPIIAALITFWAIGFLTFNVFVSGTASLVSLYVFLGMAGIMGGLFIYALSIIIRLVCRTPALLVTHDGLTGYQTLGHRTFAWNDIARIYIRAHPHQPSQRQMRIVRKSTSVFDDLLNILTLGTFENMLLVPLYFVDAKEPDIIAAIREMRPAYGPDLSELDLAETA